MVAAWYGAITTDGVMLKSYMKLMLILLVHQCSMVESDIMGEEAREGSRNSQPITALGRGGRTSAAGQCPNRVQFRKAGTKFGAFWATRNKHCGGIMRHFF